MLAPGTVLLSIFLVLPLARVVVLAFTNSRYPSSARRPTDFVGFDNLTYLLKDTDFLAAIGRASAATLVFLVIVLTVNAVLRRVEPKE